MNASSLQKVITLQEKISGKVNSVDKLTISKEALIQIINEIKALSDQSQTILKEHQNDTAVVTKVNNMDINEFDSMLNDVITDGMYNQCVINNSSNVTIYVDTH